MEIIYATRHDQHAPMNVVSIRCPACRQQGTFERLNSMDERLIKDGPPQEVIRYAGQRRCPNPTCRAHIFVVHEPNGRRLVSYPPERFDFDASSIPRPVHKAMEEALACHATQSYTAAAMMIRKTLEELCLDRKANGTTLQLRIKDLGSKIILPSELLQAIDDLRLLGNDAAHVEAKTYDDIGKEEIEAAFELTKEILKATYQYAILLGKLQGLKKTPATKAP